MNFFRLFIIFLLFFIIRLLNAHVYDNDISSVGGNFKESLIYQNETKEFSKEKNFDLKPGLLYYNVDNIVKLYQLKSDWRIQQQQVILKNSRIYLKIQINNTFIILNNDKYYLQKPFCFFNGEYLVSKPLLLMLDDFHGQKISGLIKQKPVSINKSSKNKNIISSEKTVKKKNEKYTNKNVTNNLIVKTVSESEVKTIIIDPGHGGKDPGAIGPKGLKEKDVVLRTSRILKEKLKKIYPNKRIFLTRSNDSFIDLEKRTDIANDVANKEGVTIFISIHANGSPSPSARGFETYFLIPDIKRQIISDGALSNDKEINSILNNMLNNEIIKESIELATYIQNGISKYIGKKSPNRGTKDASYIVIHKTKMPAVLVELGFITNKIEENYLGQYSYLAKICTGITDGLQKFIKFFESSKGFTK